MKYNKETLEQMDLWKLRDLATKLGLVDSGFASRTILVEYCVGVSAKKNTPKPIGEEGQAKRGRGRPKKEAAPAPVEPDLEKASTLPKKTADIEEQDTAPKKQFEPKHNKKPFVPLYDGKANKPYKDRNFSQNGKPKTQVKDFRENKDFKDKQQESSQEEYSERSGVLEICADGYGFLRAVNYQNGETDAYIANQKIKKYGLRKGDFVVASVRKIEENRPWGVQEVKLINGESPEKMERRVKFESLTPIHPDDRIKLEIAHEKSGFAVRAMDLVSPIGKGQRGMIVSPPKAGKTTLLKSVAKSISINYPEAHLMVLLIDERPEEVTDMQRSIRGEVVYSTFDELPDHHIKVTELVLERAKRMVELGKDVVILLDSLTRLTRAYNLVINPTGKILSGGIDPGAFYGPKKFFGAARNIENGGSLTILATALVDTGSRMDDVVYEEFKGTGNMEVHLDRRLAERRIFPAIDLYRSGTRREELLLNREELECAILIRKMMSGGDNIDATENLVEKIISTSNNSDLYKIIKLENMQFEKFGYKRVGK